MVITYKVVELVCGQDGNGRGKRYSGHEYHIICRTTGDPHLNVVSCGSYSLGVLRSAERFDPREGLWTKIPSMNSPRGCHSVAVLNGKLYSMGGYDGRSMVSSVEVFDPRASSWVMIDSMNMIRGYAAAAVLGESVFVIGGVKDGQNIVDTVECYKEGVGWRNTTLRAIGQRCFFSAIVL
ncbi:hypothetical protein Taro_024139 [Colocasia esculenta]|uniref:Uncharacterized protein n=1 Tax=Colocasia esculenta TaxID=4460 RepID=A0A843V8I1_COLES|nr:hypothetical protein [Colocasia esculenta]